MAAMESKTRYAVTGMDCASCARKIDTAVRRLDGISDVTVSATRGTMTVTHDGAEGRLETIEAQVRRLGYTANREAAPQAAAEKDDAGHDHSDHACRCLLYTSPSPRN